MEVLPVKTWLHRKGISVPWSLNCDLCGNTETLSHVLVECSNAYLFWDEMRTTFNLRDAFEVEWSALRFLDFGRNEETRVTTVMLLLGLHAIWQSRTDMVECHVDARPTWSHFVAKLKWVFSVVSGEADAEEWQNVEKQLEEGRRRYEKRRASVGTGHWRRPVNDERVGVG